MLKSNHIVISVEAVLTSPIVVWRKSSPRPKTLQTLHFPVRRLLVYTIRTFTDVVVVRPPPPPPPPATREDYIRRGRLIYILSKQRIYILRKTRYSSRVWWNYPSWC